MKQEFANLPESEKEAHAILAQRHLERAEFLWDELKDLLFKTKGKIAYKTMATQLGNIVSTNTICKWVQSQKRKYVVVPMSGNTDQGQLD